MACLDLAGWWPTTVTLAKVQAMVECRIGLGDCQIEFSDIGSTWHSTDADHLCASETASDSRWSRRRFRLRMGMLQRSTKTQERESKSLWAVGPSD